MPAFAQTPAASPQPQATPSAESRIVPPPENYRFPNGVTYDYQAEWRLWNAGSAALKMESAGEGQQRVIATAASAGFVALLYKVQDRFQALFDSRTFCSASISKHTEEGFRKRETLVRFDYPRRKAVLDEKNLKSGQAKHAEEDIPGCVTDVVSGFYYIASLPLQVGATYTFPLNDGGKTVEVKLHVVGREEVKTDAGTFKTLKVEPTATSGVLKERGRVWLWYSDDASRILVQMKARMFWGTLTLKLRHVWLESSPAKP